MSKLDRIVAVVLMAMVGGASGIARADVVDRVVAVVGTDAIMLSTLRDRVRTAPVTEPSKAAVERQTLDALIDEQLAARLAVEHKVVVGEDEVDRALDEIKRQNGLTDDKLRDVLVQQGYTLATYREAIFAQLSTLRLRMVLKMRYGSSAAEHAQSEAAWKRYLSARRSETWIEVRL